MRWRPTQRHMRWMAIGLALALGLYLAYAPTSQNRKLGRVDRLSPTVADTTLWAICHDIADRYGEPHPDKLVFFSAASDDRLLYNVQMEGRFVIRTNGSTPTGESPSVAVRVTFRVDAQSGDVSEIHLYDRLGRPIA